MHNIYREEVLEHYKDPQNFGKLKDYNFSARQLNPFCGDEITIYLLVRENIVDAISFEGHGCAISIASASLLTEYAKGKPLSVLATFTHENMLAMLAVAISDTRKKCALLALYTLKDCLNSK